MSKRTATLTLTLPPREPGLPAYRWLCGALRCEILEGRLRPGARLPATRDLGRQYGLARGTILAAFDQLRSEGYLRARVGAGTYVSDVLPDELLQVRRPAPRTPPARRGGTSDRPASPARRLSSFGTRAVLLPGADRATGRAFRTNQPALDLFPTTLWAQLAARRLRRASAELLLDCDPMGWRPLQSAIAAYLTTSRGVICEAEQIAIMPGMQNAIDLAARVFLDPGDRVIVEDPGYLGATRVFEAHGAEICPVRVDSEGMTIPAAELESVRLAYVTPAHQAPLGVSMSLPRRLELLEWARSTGAMLFEDDWDSEYRFAGRPMPALQGLDRHGMVLFAGSFSKVLFPSLRIGYMVVPRDLVDRFAAARSVISRHAPVLEQAVLCDFITEGHFGRHVRRMREVYAERLAVLQESAREELGGLLELADIEAGLYTVGWLGGGISGEDAMRAAAVRGIEVGALSRYSRAPMPREGLQIGFAAVDPAEIRRGVRELAIALDPLRRPSPGGRRGRSAPPHRRG